MVSLSRLVLRYRIPVVLFWLAALLAGGVSAAGLADRLDTSFSYPGRAAYEANVDVARAYGNGGATDPLVAVVTLPAGTTAEEPATRAALAAADARLAASTGTRVTGYGATGDRRLLSDDGRSAVAVVAIPYGSAEELAPRVRATLLPGLPAGTTVEVTGSELLSAANGQDSGGGVLVETLLSAVAALVVLAVVFGSLLAVVPVIVAAVSILTTMLLVTGITEVTEVSFIVQFLVSLIGLGVAIDYSLLLVTRWREERTAGADPVEAVHRAMATAGRAVVFSGLTVGLGLLVLVFLPVPFLRSVGYGAILIPLVSTAVSLTLLPVLLAAVGPRLDRRRLRKDATAGRLWTRWATAVGRRPLLAALAALAVLVPLGVAALGMRIGYAPSTALAGTGADGRVLAALDRTGVPRGVLTPIEVLLPPDADVAAAVTRFDGVEGVHAAVRPGPGRPTGTVVTVLTTDEGATTAGRRTVERVRAAAREVPGAQVGGVTAQELDGIDAIYGTLPFALVAIGLLTFVLLARAFRSLLLSAQALLLNALSIGAAYGVLTLVWQDGYGSGFWDVPALGAVTVWVPLMTFAFLFGLSMDYEVFLLTRMREEYDATGSTRRAVTEGLGRVGRLVTSAALILFLTFAALAAVPAVDVKVLATGLGAAILIDATILRALLVPALVTLGGRWTWWMPPWAARVLRVPPSAARSEPAAVDAEVPAPQPVR